MSDKTRTCSKCGKNLPLNEDYFNKNQSSNLGAGKYFRPECKKCYKAMVDGKNLAYQNSGKPERPDYGYDKKKRRTEDGYPCDNCGRTSYARKIGFDHCHETLTHRGWLCDACNRSLGILGDNVEGLSKALSYISGVEFEKILEFINEEKSKKNSVN